jgi:hypothetical protein
MGPEVEFFNPKLRHELEKKDAELIKKTGAKGAAPNGDQWVWLTSYSRIPVSNFGQKCVGACAHNCRNQKKNSAEIRII